MTMHRDLEAGNTLPESWLDAIQEFISTQATPTFKITLVNPTTIRVPAGADNDLVGIGINGRWRYNIANINAAHPGGAAAVYDVYVTAADNVFTGVGSGEVDTTDYTFGMQILAAASTPSTALYRRVATVTWDGSAITRITLLFGVLPAHASQHHPAGLDALDYTTINVRGTFAARPAASDANNGLFYFAHDQNGGTLYRSTGSAWEQAALGVTAAPTAHAASHLAGASDALAWGTVHGSGTLAARPGAAASNTGYVYLATDDNGGTLYRSTGAAWTKSAPGVSEVPTALTALPGSASAGRPVLLEVAGGEYIEMVWSQTLGKWVSVVPQMLHLCGNVLSSGQVMEQLTRPMRAFLWGPYNSAGLKPQLRFMGGALFVGANVDWEVEFALASGDDVGGMYAPAPLAVVATLTQATQVFGVSRARRSAWLDVPGEVPANTLLYINQRGRQITTVVTDLSFWGSVEVRWVSI